MKAYTDYPLLPTDFITELAPIREVTAIGYDGDKYARIVFEGTEYELKACYLYTTSGRLGEVSALTLDQRNQLPLIP